jgi:hypothetical protein
MSRARAELAVVMAQARVPVREPERVRAQGPVQARAPVRDSATALSAPDCRCRTRRRTPESESLGRYTGRAFYAA